jgi:hypothetical protein
LEERKEHQVLNPGPAQVIGEALRKLREASDLLRELEEDPRLASCVRELEGTDFGWPPPDEDEDPYLFDRLFDLFIEAGGDVDELAAGVLG